LCKIINYLLFFIFRHIQNLLLTNSHQKSIHMHLDKRIIEDYDCSYYDDSINMVEREESSNFDSKYSDNTSSALLREELINKKIEDAIQRNFVIDIKVEEPERIVERKKSINLFVSESGSKRRGRKVLYSTKSSKKKTHKADDWDNNTRKIQVHFLNFVVFYSNEVIYYHLKTKDSFFLKFSYPSKSNVNYDYVEKLKTYNIKELIENLDISPKYKRIKIKKDENINKNKLNDLCKYDWFIKLIKTKFLELFKIYYNYKNPLREIFFNGKKITLSKVNNFYALLQKNKDYEEKLIEVAKAVYLNY